jgi:hypothetical protein
MSGTLCRSYLGAKPLAAGRLPVKIAGMCTLYSRLLSASQHRRSAVWRQFNRQQIGASNCRGSSMTGSRFDVRSAVVAAARSWVDCRYLLTVGIFRQPVLRNVDSRSVYERQSGSAVLKLGLSPPHSLYNNLAHHFQKPAFIDQF